MFYSQSLLSRKGPLGNIWIAAYCFKRLRRDQIAGTDISSSIDKINSEAQMSYRVLAQLLLGIVRIFSRKVEYLFKDCEEVLINISHWAVPKEPASKHRHGIVVRKEVIRPSSRRERAIPGDPMETMLATHHHVTISAPKRFDLDRFELEGLGEEANTPKTHQQSRVQGEFEEENQAFLDKRETMAHAEFNSACFTPVDDVLPSVMMDFDLEIGDLCNSSISEGHRQEPRGDFWHQVEFGNHERLGVRISLGPILDKEGQEQDLPMHPLDLPEIVPSDINEEHDEEPEKQKRPEKLHAVILSDHDKSPGLTEGQSGTKAQDMTSNKSNLSSDTGQPSPKFRVSTPAKREQPKVFRKRKWFFDEATVCSNETMRLAIHDSSSLVCKRRKLPHTVLDTWKSSKITNLQHNFMDPLIPFISPDLKALLLKRFSNHTPPKKTPKSLNKEVDLDLEGSVPQSNSVETPAPTNQHEVSPTSKSEEVKVREPSVMETSDTGSDLMDLELGSLEKSSNDQDDRLPLRTRVVAQYLHNLFLNLKEREGNGVLSLAQLLERKRRTTCARYFYEILALKDCGCIDVKQESPYADIFMSQTPQLEIMCMNQS